MIQTLNGKKTYAVALLGVLFALSGWAGGYLDQGEVVRILFESGIASTLRAGIAKAQVRP